MSNAPLIAPAATPMVEIIRAIEPAQLPAPTPCSDWNLRALLNHLLFWGPSLEAAARKESVPPPAAAEQDVDLTAGDWAADLETHLDRLVTAWSRPEAWEGMTGMGGPQELPASTIGGMVLVELVVHGWDLARATGRRPQWTDAVLEAAYQEAVGMAEQGRQMGIFGAEVTVSAKASTLERMLGVVGRDPN